MNILIIVANPKKASFSFAMTNKYKDLAEKANHNVKVLDLYRCEHQQPFYTYENANEIEPTTEMKFFQAEIAKANEIIFVFPYWWGSMPAILKNFIDWNLSRGFAFKYVNSRPKGLLVNKTVKVFTTTGAPSFYYKITGAHQRLRKMFQKQIIDFCGMKLVGCYIYGGVDKSNNNAESILNSIHL